MQLMPTCSEWCPILWYAKVCALLSAHSSCCCFHTGLMFWSSSRCTQGEFFIIHYPPHPPHHHHHTHTTWKPTVSVGVHLLEDLLRPLLGRRLVLGHLHHRGHHLIDRLWGRGGGRHTKGGRTISDRSVRLQKRHRNPKLLPPSDQL